MTDSQTDTESEREGERERLWECDNIKWHCQKYKELNTDPDENTPQNNRKVRGKLYGIGNS